MALYSKMTEAWENHDVEAYWACFHPDWEMTWHSTGKVTNLNSMSAEQMKAIMEDVRNLHRRTGSCARGRDADRLDARAWTPT